MELTKNKIKAIYPDVEEEQVDLVVDLVSSRLLNKLRAFSEEIKEIPDALSYIVTELSLARFNRLGSEGVFQETVEGYHVQYIEKYLETYEDDLWEWAVFNGYVEDGKATVRFL